MILTGVLQERIWKNKALCDQRFYSTCKEAYWLIFYIFLIFLVFKDSFHSFVYT